MPSGNQRGGLAQIERRPENNFVVQEPFDLCARVRHLLAFKCGSYCVEMILLEELSPAIKRPRTERLLVPQPSQTSACGVMQRICLGRPVREQAIPHGEHLLGFFLAWRTAGRWRRARRRSLARARPRASVGRVECHPCLKSMCSSRRYFSESSASRSRDTLACRPRQRPDLRRFVARPCRGLNDPTLRPPAMSRAQPAAVIQQRKPGM